MPLSPAESEYRLNNATYRLGAFPGARSRAFLIISISLLWAASRPRGILKISVYIVRSVLLVKGFHPSRSLFVPAFVNNRNDLNEAALEFALEFVGGHELQRELTIVDTAELTVPRSIRSNRLRSLLRALPRRTGPA